MNAPSVLRIIGSAGLVVISFIFGKEVVAKGKIIDVVKKDCIKLDRAISIQEQELEEKRKIRDELLNS